MHYSVLCFCNNCFICSVSANHGLGNWMFNFMLSLLFILVARRMNNAGYVTHWFTHGHHYVTHWASLSLYQQDKLGEF